MAVQTTPASMPRPETGHILEHGEKAIVIYIDVQLAVGLHVDVSVQRTNGGGLDATKNHNTVLTH